MQLKAALKRFLPPIISEKLRHRQVEQWHLHESDAFRIEICKVSLEGDIYFLPKYAIHRPACKELLAGRFYEPETHRLVPALINELGGNMVHAGTFFGDMLPTFARTGARIYAFEPVLENYLLARLCLIKNGLDNVLLYHSALGERQGVVKMDTGIETHLGGASKVSDKGQLTNLVTIDSLSMENVSVIQLDIEGYELHALKGAEKTIERYRPVILIEDNEDNCGSFLRTKGYSYAGSIPGLKIFSARGPISALQSLR